MDISWEMFCGKLFWTQKASHAQVVLPHFLDSPNCGSKNVSVNCWVLLPALRVQEKTGIVATLAGSAGRLNLRVLSTDHRWAKPVVFPADWLHFQILLRCWTCRFCWQATLALSAETELACDALNLWVLVRVYICWFCGVTKLVVLPT